MSTEKKDKKSILAKIRAIFADTVEDTTAKTLDGSNVINYSVDGGDPAFLDVSDDNLTDIESGDAIFTDEALTTPYPDGTYTVTGTDFSFTITAGVVTSVTDPNGTGAGTPNAAADPVTVDPAAAPAMAAPVTTPAVTATTQLKAEDMTPEGLNAIFLKFATGTPEERIANLELVCKALMEYNFGWKIQEAQTAKTVSDAINAYNTDLKTVQTMAAKHEKILPELFDLVDTFAEAPVADPTTLTGNKKDKFDRANKREKTLERVAENIGKLREAAKA